MNINNIDIHLNPIETLNLNMESPEVGIEDFHKQVYSSRYLKENISLNNKYSRHNNIRLQLHSNDETEIYISYNIQYGLKTYDPIFAITATKYTDYTQINDIINLSIDNMSYTFEYFALLIKTLATKTNRYGNTYLEYSFNTGNNGIINIYITDLLDKRFKNAITIEFKRTEPINVED